MSEMKAFNTEATCAKCGSGDVWCGYHPKYVCGAPGCKERHWLHGCKDPSEHIHRHCRNCKSEWTEACLDAAVRERVKGAR